MTTDTTAVLSALKQALELEQNGYRFYTGAAERTLDEKGSAMFRSLADDEVLHKQVIERQIGALGMGEGWVGLELLDEVEADLVTPLFPEGKIELDNAVQSDASDLDALLFGLKIESDSFHLYAEQAQAAQDPGAKRLFQYLVEAERTHFDLLMLNYESLSSKAGWVG